MHTLQRFYDFSQDIHLVLVLPEDQITYWQSLCQTYHFAVPHAIAKGGNSRSESVRNGLAMVYDDSLVAIHDGVRPLLSTDLIERSFAKAQQSGCSIPTLSLTDTLRHISGKLIDRNSILRIQTPQVFDTNRLKEAYQKIGNQQFTDDASVYEAAGFKLHFIDGEANNIKITTAFDLAVAQIL